MNNKPSRQVLRARRRAGLSTPQRQRGAAAVFAAVAMIAGLAATLLAINIGMLYYAQRDLQRMATVGAMAGVQVSSGCRNPADPGVPGSLALATTQVQQAIKNNNGNVGLLTGIGGAPAVQVGMISNNSGTHTFVPLADGSSQINAVRVNLERTAPSILGGGLFPGGAPVTLMASATAQEQPLGSFSIGSTLLSLNTATSVLNPLLSGLLGASVNLSAVDYQGLAQTQISLANLMVAANVTDLNSLLAVDTNVAGLQTLLAAATNTVNPSVASLLTGLTLGTTQSGTDVPLAELLGNVGVALNPTVTDVAANVPFVNVLDMLTAIGEAAAAKNGITLALPVSINIPGLVGVYAFLQVLEPPQLSGLGPVGTTQTTAQVILKVRANVGTGGVLGLLSLLGTAANINLGIDVNVANAKGTIATLVCPSDSAASPSATVAVNTGLVTLQLGGFFGSPSAAPSITATDAPLLNITALGIPVVTLGVKVPPSTTLGGGSGTAGPFTEYAAPVPVPDSPHSYYYVACNSTTENTCAASDSSNPQTPVSSVDIASGITKLVGQLSAKNNLSVDVLGIGLGGLLDPIISALNTALLTPVTTLVDSLLNPLLAALGVQVGSGTLLWQLFENGQPLIVTSCLPLSYNGSTPPTGVCPSGS